MCTEEELNSNFYSLKDEQKGLVDTNKNEFVCIDKEESHIYGDYNSVTTRVIEM